MKKNKKKKISPKSKRDKDLTYKNTTALIFDRYYTRQPNAALIMTVRVLLSAALAALCVSYVFSMYTLPIGNVNLPLISAGISLGFSLLFLVVRRRIAIPVLLIIGGIIILSNLNVFKETFSYFIDGILLECNGEILDAASMTIHPFSLLEHFGKPTVLYSRGAVFGSVLLCAVFALITSAGTIGRPRLLPSLITFVLMLIPLLFSQRLRFAPQIIPIVAIYGGLFAVGYYYRDGLAVRHVYATGGYRKKVETEHKRFDASVRSQTSGKATARGVYYLKYNASILSAAAIFLAAGFIVSLACQNARGIDYEAIIEKVSRLDFGFGSGSKSLTKDAEVDYFANPFGSVFNKNNRLKLTSPSTSNKEIIKISKTVTYKPIYLRGDIGIEFDGTSWSSPVTELPGEWEASGLNRLWLPVDTMAVFLNQSMYANGWEGSIYKESEHYISVEYLCDTDVCFAPAYDDSYMPYQKKQRGEVEIFGDYAARFKSDTSIGKIMNYAAVTPPYTDASTESDFVLFADTLRSCDNSFRPSADYLMEDFISSMAYQNDLEYIPYDDYSRFYEKYKTYVQNNYLSVPEKLKPQLDAFAEESGLTDFIAESKIKHSYMNYGLPFKEYLFDRFSVAMAVRDFLKSNYTYSLDAKIDGRNPVMSFLNDTKSGHCALYASSMTLLLRNMGIPARYCTGVAASSAATVQTLRSKDLHAWCEVYFDELGWVTFDPTASSTVERPVTTTSTSSGDQFASSAPGGTSGTSGSQANSEALSSASSQQSKPESNKPDNSNNSYQNGSNGEESPAIVEEGITFAQALPYILTILGIGAVIALIVLAITQYEKLKRRANKRVREFRRERDSEYVYEKLLAVLKLCHIRPSAGEQPHLFMERASAELGFAIADYALLERIAFGSSELDTEERAVLANVFDKFYRAAEKRFKPIGKIKLRLLILSRRV